MINKIELRGMTPKKSKRQITYNDTINYSFKVNTVRTIGNIN